MSGIPKCFDMIKEVDSSQALPLVVQYFKNNLNMSYNEINALKAILGLNNWQEVDVDISEEYYNLLPVMSISCDELIEKYFHKGISNYCLACPLSNDYKNSNIAEEEAIISYLLNNPELKKILISHNINSTIFKSVVLYSDQQITKAEPLLAMLFDLFINKEDHFNNTSLFKKVLVEEYKYNESIVKIACDYYVSLKDAKISDERLKEALCIVLGVEASNAIIINIDNDKAIPGILSIENPDSDEKYFMCYEKGRKEPQITFLEPNKNKRKKHMPIKRFKDNGASSSPDKPLIKNDIDDLQNQITIDDMCFYKSEVEINAKDLHNDVEERSNTTKAKKKDLEIKGCIPDDNEEIPEDDPNLPAIPCIEINCFSEYTKLQSKFITSGTLYMKYLESSFTLLLLYSNSIYVINMADEGIKHEIALLFVSPSLIKVVDTLIPFGSIYGNGLLKFDNVFDITAARYLIDCNFLFMNTIKERIANYKPFQYNKDKRKVYVKQFLDIIANYKEYTRILSEKSLNGLYAEHILLSGFIASSLDLLISELAPRDLVTAKVVSDKPLKYCDTYNPGIDNIDTINTSAWIIEKSIISILRSKISNMTNLRLYNVNSTSVTIDVDRKHLPALFDVMNQYTICSFKNIIDDRFSPTVLMNIKYESN